MAVDGLNVPVVGDGDVVGLNADDFAEVGVDCVDGVRALGAAGVEEEPEVCERCWEGGWDADETFAADVGEDVEDEEDGDGDGPGR